MTLDGSAVRYIVQFLYVSTSTVIKELKKSRATRSGESAVIAPTGQNLILLRFNQRVNPDRFPVSAEGNGHHDFCRALSIPPILNVYPLVECNLTKVCPVISQETVKVGERHQLLEIRSRNIGTARISIIIPVLNEVGTIKAALASTHSSTNVEVIVVDGGSLDSTVQIAQSLGVKVLSAPASRAWQMNVGAKAATGKILLFLHADTRLPFGFDTMVRTALEQPEIVAGAFALRIDASLLSLRLIERGVNWRSRFLQMPYGDQAIFLKAETFHDLGGFPKLSIMEDFELMRRLRRCGRIAIIPAPVETSARRWLQKGVFQTTLINQIVILAYLLGISPERIVHWYRRQ